ncbi:MAG TPA: glycosyltransferase [Gemmatimonadaceae bacterium]|nr:glycosyltransferase [Gemmatimonadaceae bacterium]
MRDVLIVAPSFTPSSNPPTQRVRFFARHLPTFGWRPRVVSVDPRFYEEPPDAEIASLVPPGLEVLRTRALPARVTRPFGIGDLGIRAYWPMRAALRDVCRERRPALLFIPGPPWHTFLLGADMREEFGIPYVLDYIDPWVSAAGADGRWWTKAYWYRRVAVALEPRAVRGAARITAVSDGTNEGVRAMYPALPASMFTGIPYGFEPSDFETLRRRPRPNGLWSAGDGALHLVSVGAMLPNGYETLRAVFAAIQLLRQTAVGARLRLHFVGTTYEPTPRQRLVEPVAREMGLGDIVTEHPARVPYLDALNLLCSADGIVALGSSEAHYTASKIFPSILARRPLLAAYHAASSVCDVVRRACGGELVTYDDVDRASAQVPAIAAALTRMLTPGGYDPDAVRWDSFADFSAERMTERLARVFEAACASS